MQKNLSHMAKEHSFFIHDIEYLVDIEGMMQYLCEKVHVAYCCVYCEKIFRSAEAAKHHMVSLSHCKLRDEEDEIIDFYDYSSTWEGVDSDATLSSDSGNQLAIIDPVRSKVATLEPSGYSLHLPISGKTAVHRDMVMYYNQRYRPQDTRDSVVINKLMNRYRLLGWKSSTIPDRIGQKIFARSECRRIADQSRLGWKANSLQRFFRRQVDC